MGGSRSQGCTQQASVMTQGQAPTAHLRPHDFAQVLKEAQLPRSEAGALGQAQQMSLMKGAAPNPAVANKAPLPLTAAGSMSFENHMLHPHN